MPAGPLVLGELLAQAVEVLHMGLHPLSTLAHRLLGLQVASDLDLAAWALATWVLGSRESELAKKLGFVIAAALAAAAVLEAEFLAG